MMGKGRASTAKNLDWSEFTSSLPKEGVVYPKDEAKKGLIARLKAAFSKAGVRQVA
jgi:hypothetical protein